MTHSTPAGADIETTLTAPTFRSAGAAALFSRSVMLFSGLASSLLLPLVLDQHGVGQYFLSQLIIAAVATFCQLGFTFSIPSQVTHAVAHNDLGRARGLAARILCFSAGVGAIVVVVAIVTSSWIAQYLDPADRATWIAALPMIAAIGAFASLTSVLVELLRAVHAVRAAANLAALASVSAAIYAGVLLASGQRATLFGALLAVLLGSAASVLLGLVLFWRRSADWPRATRGAVPAIAVLRGTLPNLYTTLVLFGLANFDLMILGSLGSLTQVAQYGLAPRFSAPMLIPLGIANAAAAPLAVHARTIEDTASLANILTRVVLSGSGAAVVIYIGFVSVGYGFITFWNASYQDAYWLALVLGLGNVLHACGGAAGVLLMIWGDQKRAFIIVVGTGAVAIIACLLGYHFGGVFGLAFAAAFANALQVGCFVVRVRARFGLDPSLIGQFANWRRSRGH